MIRLWQKPTKTRKQTSGGGCFPH